MQIKSTLTKIFIVMVMTTLVMAWGSMSYAQSSGGYNQNPSGTMNKPNDQGTTDQSQSTTPGSSMMMNRYLIMIPASGTANTCQDVMKDFSSNIKSQSSTNTYSQNQTGTDNMGENQGTMDHGSNQSMGQSNMQSNSNWQWGCSSDDKTLYVFTTASSEQAALRDVPSSLRKDAHVIRMSNFSGQPMQNQMKDHGPSTKSKTGGSSNY